MKKYKLIKSDKVLPSGRPLFQVVALRDFGFVKKGDKGGYIRSEANLSHEGNCWVSGKAQIFGDAKIFGDAQVSGNAQICDDAMVYGNAQIFDDAQIFGTAQICGTAQVFGTALVYGTARIFRDTQITAGHAFATKNNSWDITEVDNGNGTSTLYANAVFEPAELKPCHGGQTGKFCSECGEKL